MGQFVLEKTYSCFCKFRGCIVMCYKVLVLVIALFTFIQSANLKRNRRIINGHPISTDVRHPADVSLKRWDKEEKKFRHFCGGIIVHISWILTAAHCFPRGILPVPLVLQIENDDNYHVDQLLRYPHQERVKTAVDLALLRTRETIQGIVAVLPPPGYKPRGECQVCGLGTLDPKKNVFPNTLHCASVLLMERRQCGEALGPYISLKSDALCAGGDDTDACLGDSGSALQCQSENKEELVLTAVVSWGRSCAVKGQPGIYTDIRAHLKWLLKVISGSSSDEESAREEIEQDNSAAYIHVLGSR